MIREVLGRLDELKGERHLEHALHREADTAPIGSSLRGEWIQLDPVWTVDVVNSNRVSCHPRHQSNTPFSCRNS